MKPFLMRKICSIMGNMQISHQFLPIFGPIWDICNFGVFPLTLTYDMYSLLYKI